MAEAAMQATHAVHGVMGQAGPASGVQGTGVPWWAATAAGFPTWLLVTFLLASVGSPIAGAVNTAAKVQQLETDNAREHTAIRNEIAGLSQGMQGMNQALTLLVWSQRSAQPVLAPPGAPPGSASTMTPPPAATGQWVWQPTEP